VFVKDRTNHIAYEQSRVKKNIRHVTRSVLFAWCREEWLNEVDLAEGSSPYTSLNPVRVGFLSQTVSIDGGDSVLTVQTEGDMPREDFRGRNEYCEQFKPFW